MPFQASLVGLLAKQGDEIVLLLERISLDGGISSGDRWETRARGDDARVVVVQKMAIRLAFDLAKTRLTSNWQSFAAFREALDRLAQSEPKSDGRERLEASCLDLQHSLRYDPSNWISRFHLSTVQRKLGRNEAAAEHLALLERMATNAAGSLPSMHDFLKKHPEFLHTIRYNKAVALSKMKTWEAHHKALDILDSIIDDLGPGASAAAGAAAAVVSDKNTERIRLEMLARSARAAALPFELERTRRSRGSNEDPSRQRKFEKEIFSRIEKEKQWIDNAFQIAHLDWRAYSLAYAVIYNAYGRACFLLRHGDAIEPLHQALAMSPDFVDSYVTLAEAYMRERRRTLDWLNRAQESLTQALAIDPANQKAHYLLGKLLADPVVGKYKEAKEHLTKADLFAASYPLLAEILVDQDDDLRGAIVQMRRSIALSPQPDYRFERFVDYVLQLYEKESQTSPHLLKEAKDIASRLRDRGESPGDRNKGAELLLKIGQRSAAIDAQGQLSAGFPSPGVASGSLPSAMQEAAVEPPQPPS